VQFGMADLAAVAVPVQDRRAGRARQPPVTPADHHHQYFHQVQAHLGEHVLMPHRACRVLPPLKHPGVGERPEPFGEHLPRDAQVLLQLVEPVDADEYVPHDQGGPRLARHVHGARDRARHRAKLGPLHSAF
jgi:hypothetical protein